jgi:hypothetical protein
MDGQGYGKLIGDDSAEAEANFRETLLRLKAEGASDQRIAETVMRDPFVFSLLWIVTSSGYARKLRAGKGARPVHCVGNAMPNFSDEKPQESSTDLGLDLLMAIDELENPRQRAVMRLSILGHKYRAIAEQLTKNDPEAKKVTYDMVRDAHEKAREILRKKLGLPPAA